MMGIWPVSFTCLKTKQSFVDGYIIYGCLDEYNPELWVVVRIQFVDWCC